MMHDTRQNEKIDGTIDGFKLDGELDCHMFTTSRGTFVGNL